MDNDNLIQKWLNGELSTSELTDFEQSADFEYYQSIVKNAQRFKASNFQTVDDFKTFKATKLSSQTQQQNFSKIFMPILKMAGVFVVLFGLYTLFFNDSLVTVTTVAGEKNTVVLPDASEIVLNAESTISYNKKHWKNQRMVELAGEAFFKVAKGETFDVISQKDTIRVVGTQFNVKRRSNYFEVTCYEGAVKVLTKTQERLLKQGDQLVILNDNLTERKLSDTKPYWMQNLSSFSAVPLQEVFHEIERQFNITISTEHIDASQLFTGGFQHDDLQKALQSVTEPMNLRFEMDTEKSVTVYEVNQ